MLEKWLAHYYSERFGRKLMVFPSGFFVYEIVDGQFYFAEFYIAPEFRKSSKSFQIMMGVALDLALAGNCRKFSARVDLTAKNASEVIISRLKYGFKIVESSPGSLGMVKELF